MRAVSDYCKLFARIWNDPDFIALDSDPQRVYMMLLSYPTRDNAGVLPLTMRRWVNATADMTVERFTAALQALVAARFVVVDWNTEEVLIRTFTKNDETYRQPKLWANAVKSALKVQSVALRREILTQFQALPPVTSTDAQKITAETVKALVDTLKDDDGKGYPEGYPEGYPIPPGVGALRTRPYAPAPAPATAAAPPPGASVVPIARADGRGNTLARFERINDTARSPEANAIAQAFSASLPVPVETGVLCQVAVQIDKCLRDQIPPPAIAAGIRAWSASDSWSPNLIPNFVMKANRGTSHGKPTTKALGYQDAAAELLAEMSRA